MPNPPTISTTLSSSSLQWPQLSEDHPTPSVVVHRPTVHRNLQRMQSYCDQHRLRLRPHTKTHKSLEIAKEQLALGAHGLTVAKAGEAEVMSQVCNDIFVAYPAVGIKRLEMIADLAKRIEVSVGIDSVNAAQQLQAAAQRAGAHIGLLVDLEVGFFRTGVHGPERSVELCQLITKLPNLKFRGFMCFPGHLLPTAGSDEWQRYSESIGAVLERMERSGIPVETVSGGSTPTATQSHRNPHLNEIRPGTYVYNDMNEVRLGVASIEDCAARVLATVVSVPSSHKFVIDAGSKTLSSDRNCVDPDSGFGLVLEFPDAKITRLSEEHGEVSLPEESVYPLPRVGDRVWIIPNHICVCINLQNHFYAWDFSGIVKHRVDARGMLT